MRTVTAPLQALTCDRDLLPLRRNALTCCYATGLTGPVSRLPRRRQLTTHHASNTREHWCPTRIPITRTAWTRTVPGSPAASIWRAGEPVTPLAMPAGYAAGRAQAYAEGYAEGLADGRAESAAQTSARR